MKTRRTTLPATLFLVAALLSLPCLARKEIAPEQGLLWAERSRFEANVKADTAALDKLLSTDLAYTHSNGELETKAQFIASLTNGKRDYLAMEPISQDVHVAGDVGLIHGQVRVTVASGGAPSTFSISYDDVWVWKDKRWQLISWRSTRLPDAPPAGRDEAGARGAVLARFEAALRGDVAALDKLLAEDLDYCTFRGDCETKAQYLGEVTSGRLKYVSIKPSVAKVKLFADNAVVTGLATVTAIRDGIEHTIHISWAGVVAWRDARWQMTTWTSTLLESHTK